MADLRDHLLNWLDNARRSATHDDCTLGEQLAVALKGVVYKHRPMRVPGPRTPECAECTTPVGTVRRPAWPCPTILAIADDLEVSADG